MAATTCQSCQAHEIAVSLRATEYHSPRHLAAIRLAFSLDHSGCTLDRNTPLTDRMLITFG
jgi:hypothetical protein